MRHPQTHASCPVHRSRRPIPRTARGLIVACAAVALLLTAGAASASPYQKGEPIQFTGLVTDSQGKPIAGVQVLLEASRNKFSYKKLRRTTVDTFKVSTTTDERGEYKIRWPWNDYYNGFELMVAIPVRRADGERLRILTRSDITERALGGSPVVVPLVITDTSFLDAFRHFLAGLDSQPKRDLYQKLGRPDKVDETVPGEVSWWYFETGKVYRFSGLAAPKIDSFEPIKKF